MTPPKMDAGFIRMPEDEFEAMLGRAAEQGARRALADVGVSLLVLANALRLLRART